MEIIALIIPALIAGLLTFLAPCTLPLAPAYLGFISGVSASDLQDPEKQAQAKKKIFLNGVAFVVGFTIIFVSFGFLAGLLGGALSLYRVWLTRIGGIFVILFGMSMVGLFKIPFLSGQKRMQIPKFLEKGHALTSMIIGAVFALGWTPCVGPILGTILLLASTSSTALQGAFLLLIFSIGLAIPFLLLALGVGFVSKSIQKITKYLHIIEYIGGVFLILLGILLVSNRFSLLVSWGFQLLEIFNYSKIIEFL